MMAAAPVDNPEVKNKGPKMALFYKGRALNADSNIPV